MQRKKTSEGKSLSLAFGFCLIIFAILIIYFGWKIAKFVSLSQFDGKHEYILEIDTSNAKEVVAFLPEGQSINTLTIHNIPSGESLGGYLSLPTDAVIKDDTTSISSLLQKEIFTFGRGGIPFVDAIKLWMFANSVQQANIANQEIPFSSSQETIDAIVPKLFTDKDFYQEAATIAVINASNMSGVGNRFAKYLTNVGGNVIIVNTADSVQNKTTLSYSGTYSYSIQKLEKIMHLKAQKLDKKDALADITITIGTDIAGKFAN